MRTKIIIGAAVAAVIVAYLVGSNRGGAPSTGAPAPAATAPAAAAGPAVAAAPAPGPPPAAASQPPPPADTGQAQFWRLVDETRQVSGNDTGRQSGMLADRLRKLPASQIVDFERQRQQLDKQAYTWEIWGAAYVIEDGCSDDCFRNFRAYLISLGRGPYEMALRNPDSLASVVQDAEQGDWENADNVAPDAYQGVTGNDFPFDTPDLSGNPRGQQWDDKDVAALVRRYPRLAARFR
jgi:hypothetical protein